MKVSDKLLNKYGREALEKAISLRLQGMSSTEIISETGIKLSTLNKLFKDNDVKLSQEALARCADLRWSRHREEVVSRDTKRCSSCQIDKSVDEFNKDSTRLDGRYPICLSCRSSKAREYAPKVKEYKSKNRDRIREWDRNWYRNNKDRKTEHNKKWISKNIDRVKERESRRYLENRDIILEKRRVSPANRKRKPTNRSPEYRALQKERSRIYREAIRRATPRWLSKEDRKRIKNFYKNCPKGYHVDHILPINGMMSSGLHVPWNLQYLPGKENGAKSNLEIIPFSVGKCYQYLMREKTTEEDKAIGFNFDLKASDFDMAHERITEEHRDFIVRYEWLGKVGYNVKWVFTARHQGLLAGVVMLSEPTSYSCKEKELEALIQRGAAASWAPKNLNSRLVMFALRWMVNNTSKRIFVAYSDPSAGEIGTIYQACNFDYLGNGFGSRVSYVDKDGKTVSGQFFNQTNLWKKVAKELGIQWLPEWSKTNKYKDLSKIPVEIIRKIKDRINEIKMTYSTIPIPPKGKYAKIIGKDKREQRELEAVFKNWTPKPYPKRTI